MELDGGNERALRGVYSDLVRVVRRAILTAITFLVTEGLGTRRRQKHIVAIGASRTIKSRRLSEHAVNFAPLGQGKPALDWAPVYSIAEAMGQAAHAEMFELQLGGSWNGRLNTINGTPERESAAYVERRRAARRKASVDGPHYELHPQLYPSAA